MSECIDELIQLHTLTFQFWSPLECLQMLFVLFEMCLSVPQLPFIMIMFFLHISSVSQGGFFSSRSPRFTLNVRSKHHKILFDSTCYDVFYFCLFSTLIVSPLRPKLLKDSTLAIFYHRYIPVTFGLEVSKYQLNEYKRFLLTLHHKEVYFLLFLYFLCFITEFVTDLLQV